MKPLLVGEQPSKRGDPVNPIEGRIGARLAECCGLTFDAYLQTFDRVNLLRVRTEYTDYALGKGDSFNVREASKHARTLQAAFVPGQIVLILGKRAASAFGLTHVAYFEWFALNPAKAVVVPHPSGVNRWWNNPVNAARMDAFMRGIAEQAR